VGCGSHLLLPVTRAHDAVPARPGRTGCGTGQVSPGSPSECDARPMASRIYTKRGDDGSTGRFLGGRVSKADLIVEASGDVDEAVAVLGVARASCDDAEMAEALLQVQRELFVLGADVATHPQRREKLQEGVSLVSEA